jgi:hypothetical protein
MDNMDILPPKPSVRETLIQYDSDEDMFDEEAELNTVELTIINDIMNLSLNTYLEEELAKKKTQDLIKEKSLLFNDFLITLKRINNIKKNNIIELLIEIIEKYINNIIITYNVDQEVYTAIYKEIKQIRIKPDILDLLKNIILLN